MLVIWNSNVRSISLCRQVFRSYFYIPLMRSRHLTKTSILSSESGMPLLFSKSKLCLRPTPIYFPKSPCAYKPGITPLSKFTCTYEPAVYIPRSLSLRVPGALPLFQVFEGLRTINISPFFKPCTYEPGIFSVTNSSLLTTKDILRSPCLRITVRPSVEMVWNTGEGGGGLRLGRYVFLDQRSVTDWVGSSSCIYSERLGK